MAHVKAFDLPEQVITDDADPVDIERLLASELNEAEGDPLAVLPGEGETLFVGIDSEWEYDPETGQNEVICYTAVIDAGGFEKGYIVYPDGPTKADRLSLEKFLGHVVHQAKKEGQIPVWPKDIVVFCHFMRADIVNFKDFWTVKQSTNSNAGTIGSLGLKARDEEGEYQD
ncbi:hypothetical protein [Neptuniibacter sp.]|uniref:hypothetical protein n=1 Tax=Neptuniibacter sp. TaxID=1962643 RepID=UPI0026351DAA|nr:hypothetical protein [Neptuniibacter sp.]MCP4595411.1 hypothetical protein [Neptuniibacter sp.]